MFFLRSEFWLNKNKKKKTELEEQIKFAESALNKPYYSESQKEAIHSIMVHKIKELNKVSSKLLKTT